MFRTVSITDLKPGMFVHDVGLSWWHHDFLRSRFPLRSAQDIERLHEAGVSAVVIDTSRGLDLEVEPEPQPQPVLAQKAGATQITGTRAQPGASAPPAHARHRPPAFRRDTGSRHAGRLPPGEPQADRRPRPGGRVPLEQELQVARRLVRDADTAVRRAMRDARTGRLSSMPQLRDLARQMVASTGRNPGAMLSLVGLKARDSYTFMHCVAVGTFMIALGRTLGLSDEELCVAGTAGLLHDLGKARIPVHILNKPGPLTRHEFDRIRLHPELGHAILDQAGFEEAAVLDVVMHHHERLDGRGYPGRLAGGHLSRLARMAAVADVYDAVTSERAYHVAMPPSAALRMMLADAGAHFDDEILRAFVHTVGIFPNGSLVRLASGRLAVVIEQHPTDPVRPRVRVFFSIRSDLHLPVEELDLAHEDDRIVRYEDPEGWGLDLARYRNDPA